MVISPLTPYFSMAKPIISVRFARHTQHETND